MKRRNFGPSTSLQPDRAGLSTAPQNCPCSFAISRTASLALPAETPAT